MTKAYGGDIRCQCIFDSLIAAACSLCVQHLVRVDGIGYVGLFVDVGHNVILRFGRFVYARKKSDVPAAATRGNILPCPARANIHLSDG